MKNKLNLQTGIIILMIFLVALSRFIPHPPNFTPMGAIALFGAAYFSKKYLAFLIPLAAWWISDLFLDNLIYAKQFPEYYHGFSWVGNPIGYLCLGMIVVLGWFMLKKISTFRLVGTATLAAILFFLVTNFTAMLADPIYTKDFNGLLQSYIAGLPFFRNTLAGNLIYSAVLFGVYEWFVAKRSAPHSQQA
ncbi:MAG: DUF6580 family putative transport protein [Saprospiraceae bacterium]